MEKQGDYKKSSLELFKYIHHKVYKIWKSYKETIIIQLSTIFTEENKGLKQKY